MDEDEPIRISDKAPPRCIPLTHGKVTLVDASDYDMLIGFKWRAVRIRQTWYAHTYVGPGAEEFMHRLIMGAGRGQRIDHRNGDGLDNQRSNLRPITNALNQANRRHIRSKSGFKGVTFDGTRKVRPWRAHITIDGNMKFLGAYATAEEAARAYDAAARNEFREYSCTNEDLKLLDRQR